MRKVNPDSRKKSKPVRLKTGLTSFRVPIIYTKRWRRKRHGSIKNLYNLKQYGTEFVAKELENKYCTEYAKTFYTRGTKIFTTLVYIALSYSRIYFLSLIDFSAYKVVGIFFILIIDLFVLTVLVNFRMLLFSREGTILLSIPLISYGIKICLLSTTSYKILLEDESLIEFLTEILFFSCLPIANIRFLLVNVTLACTLYLLVIIVFSHSYSFIIGNAILKASILGCFIDNVIVTSILRRKLWVELKRARIVDPFYQLKNLVSPFSITRYIDKWLLKIKKQSRLQNNKGQNNLHLLFERVRSSEYFHQLRIDSNSIIREGVRGRGATCEVYQVNYLGSSAVLKAMNLSKDGDTLINDFINEMNSLQKLRHANVVQLLGVVLDTSKLTVGLVLENMSIGTLRSALNHNFGREDAINWADTKGRCALDIATGMMFLHEKHIIHRDLKSENILVNASLTCKISDFATCRKHHGDEFCQTLIGTPFWRSPEMLSKKGYNEKIDVFSFSIILLELETQEDPFVHMTVLEQLEYPQRVMNEGFCLGIPEAAPDVIKQLMFGCGLQNPETRPSFVTVRRKLLKFMDMLQGSSFQNDLTALGKLMFDQLILSKAYKKINFKAGGTIIEYETYGSECYIVSKGVVDIYIPFVQQLSKSSTANENTSLLLFEMETDKKVVREINTVLDDIVSLIESDLNRKSVEFKYVASCGRYDYFGEVALLVTSKRSARCVAKTDVTCVAFGAEALNTVFDSHIRSLIATTVLMKFSKGEEKAEISENIKSARGEIYSKIKRLSSAG